MYNVFVVQGHFPLECFGANSLYIRKPCTIFFYEKVVKWCAFYKQLEIKVKIGDLCTNFILCTNLLFYRQADKIIRLATCLIRLNDLPDTVNLAVYIYFLNSLGVIP